jgi:lysophospholipase L1-like esterase
LNDKLLRDEPIVVAFLGGSITEGFGASNPEATSWRALTETYLKRRFPDKNIHCINAGVGGTNSAFGSHRLREHVLDKGQVDLCFVEFAVNDGENREESIKGMEGIVRQFRRLSPRTDLCFIYTAADKNLVEGIPFNIAVHEEIAGHYGIPSVNFAAGIRALVKAGRIRWEDAAPDRVHPNDRGYALYAGFLQDYLETAISVKSCEIGSREKVDLELPQPLNEGNYEYGAMLDVREAKHMNGFQFKTLDSEPLMNWRFSTEHLYTDAPNAELAFTVDGQGAGLLLLCGPDSGIFEYSLDGFTFHPINLFDDWCLQAFRPVIALFPNHKGKRSRMKIVIRNTNMKDERSTGTTLRIMKFLCH